jgi:RHH-type proline utilization regulon transcriptional repressor/proline dehydrogenase/delta 1-pyrroline-5-carboxylate dehydrogenase
LLRAVAHATIASLERMPGMASSPDARDVEQRTQELGREMLERMRAHRPFALSPLWWEERLLNLLMQHELLKQRLFQFIAVLPTLHDPADAARHLREYFVDPERAGPVSHASAEADRDAALAELEGGPPRLREWLARRLDFERLDSVPARVSAWFARQGARTMARRFIAGANITQAERTIRRLRERRLTFTVDVLGEAALSDREALEYQRIYLDLLTELPRRAQQWPAVPQVDQAGGRALPRVNVSVKLTALCPQLDASAPQPSIDVAKERLRPLLRQAAAAGAHLHVDMEHYAIKDLTLDICRELFCEPEFRDCPHLGLVLQAYLKDAERDALEVVDWVRRRGTPIWVRLVKGAYWDTETALHQDRGWPCPVWSQKWQSDACFERCCGILLRNHPHVYTAFGSHNVRSLAHAMALRERFQVPAHAFELQTLFGMGAALQKAAVEMGQRCRVYTPYGDMLPGMAYLIRRLLENTANESFLRQSVDEHAPIAALLADPARAAPALIAQEALPEDFEHTSPADELDDLVIHPFRNVPSVDFAREENRRRMQASLASIRAVHDRRCASRVAGESVQGDAWRALSNPSRPAELLARVACAGPATVDRAIRAAEAALPDWQRVTLDERAARLVRAARLLEQRRFQLAATVCAACGRTWRSADADVSKAIDLCRLRARQALRRTELARPAPAGHDSGGVTGIISAFSEPISGPVGMIAAALLSGSTVVLKPALAGSLTAEILMDIFAHVDLPRGALNLVLGPGSESGAALAAHPGVRGVAFQGSAVVRRTIERIRAPHAPASTPAGGDGHEFTASNAILVDSDADLDQAVRGVMLSAFACAGQSCMAASRCIVHGAVHDRFVRRLVEASRSLPIGAAEEPQAVVTPLIDAAAGAAVRAHVEEARGHARCALEVDTSRLRAESGAQYVGPVILTDAGHARLACAELFGPVLWVLRAREIDEALEWFNACGSMRVGAIYSRSPRHVERARVECLCRKLRVNAGTLEERIDPRDFAGPAAAGFGAPDVTGGQTDAADTGMTRRDALPV